MGSEQWLAVWGFNRAAVPVTEPAPPRREVGTLLGRISATVRSQVALQLVRR